MAVLVTDSPDGRAWIALPNRSLSAAGRRQLLGAAAAVCLIIAGGFGLAGAWPVLPFAGVELAALWWALRHLDSRADDAETIRLESGRLTVRSRRSGREERHDFHPYWARLRVERGFSGCRLFLRCHGREVEIGTLLTEAEKNALAEHLRAALGA